MMRYTLLTVAFIASQFLNAQNINTTSCNLAMEIPNRLLVISSDDKEIVYRDRKTNAILTFTKAGIQDYDFNFDFTVENVVNELSEDPKYVDIQHEEFSMDYSDVVVINWTRSMQSPNRRNNHNALAMMDVCGQYYTFKFSMPDSKKGDVIPVFMDILASVEKTKS